MSWFGLHRSSKVAESQQIIDGYKGLSEALDGSWERRLSNLEAELGDARQHQATCEAQVAALQAELIPLRGRVVELEATIERRKEPRTVVETSETVTTTTTETKPKKGP